MSKKTLLGGLVVALIMFAWSSIAHVALPTAEAGISTTENEDAIMTALKSNLNHDGFYFLPGHAWAQAKSGPKEQQQAAMAEFQKKVEAGPRAMIIYHPSGAKMFEPKMLAKEFLSDLVAGLIIAWMFVMALPNLRSVPRRVLFVTFTGLLPWLIVEFSYWNWYELPTAYSVGQIIDYVAGAILAGFFLAWFFRREAGTLRTEAKAA